MLITKQIHSQKKKKKQKAKKKNILKTNNPNKAKKKTILKKKKRNKAKQNNYCQNKKTHIKNTFMNMYSKGHQRNTLISLLWATWSLGLRPSWKRFTGFYNGL